MANFVDLLLGGAGSALAGLSPKDLFTSGGSLGAPPKDLFGGGGLEVPFKAVFGGGFGDERSLKGLISGARGAGPSDEYLRARGLPTRAEQARAKQQAAQGQAQPQAQGARPPGPSTFAGPTGSLAPTVPLEYQASI